VKFIDSRQDLSVQVHPDDKLAMERHGCQGKTEMWYIIKSDVGAKIYWTEEEHHAR
jgi:mannose-6-phosphate isomerase